MANDDLPRIGEKLPPGEVSDHLALEYLLDVASIFETPHQGSPAIVPKVVESEVDAAAGMYAGATVPATLEVALNNERRKTVRAAILTNIHLPWGTEAIQELNSVSDAALAKALQASGCLSVPRYVSERVELAERVRELAKGNKRMVQRAGMLRHDRGLPWFDFREAFGSDAGAEANRCQELGFGFETSAEELEGLEEERARLGDCPLLHDMLELREDWDDRPCPITDEISAAFWQDFGDDVYSWRIALDMLWSWEGTLSDLVETVRALA